MSLSINIQIIYIYCVKINALRKLGSSSIGCENFSIAGGITNGVSVQGRPQSSRIGYEGFVQKGQGEARLNYGLVVYPSEKYEFVSWDDFPFPTEWKVIKFHGSSHHQPNNLVGYSHVPPFTLW